MKALGAGADVVTIPSNILEQIFEHPLTDIGYKLFTGYLRQDTSYHKESDNSELGKVILADVDQFIIFVLRPFIDGLTSLVIFIAIVFYLVFFLDFEVNLYLIYFFVYY